MKKYLVTIAIGGILLLLGSIPCLADAGTGIGVSVSGTVITGDTGGGTSHSWGGSSSGDRRTQTSDNTTVSDNTTASLPVITPDTPSKPDAPSYTPPEPYVYVPVEGQPLPSTVRTSVNYGSLILTGLIALAVLGGGFMLWKFVNKQRAKKNVKKINTN